MYEIYINGTTESKGTLICSSQVDELAIIDPVVTLEENSAGTFEFTLPG